MTRTRGIRNPTICLNTGLKIASKTKEKQKLKTKTKGSF